MQKEGKYIYGIIGTTAERNFGPIAIGQRGDDVTTVGFGGLGMLVSDSPVADYPVSRENVCAHERVIEEAMKEFTVLPVRFCTIAAGTEKIRNLLDRRQREFNAMLRQMDYKVELNVKAVWKDMDAIFREVIEENAGLRRLKESFQNTGKRATMQAIEAGRMVKDALNRKKDMEAEAVASILKRAAFDYRPNSTWDDRVFLNMAFLVDRAREKEFDNLMNDLGDIHRDRIKFIYVGHLPPYNFATITIHHKEWEE